MVLPVDEARGGFVVKEREVGSELFVLEVERERVLVNEVEGLTAFVFVFGETTHSEPELVEFLFDVSTAGQLGIDCLSSNLKVW